MRNPSTLLAINHNHPTISESMLITAAIEGGVLKYSNLYRVGKLSDDVHDLHSGDTWFGPSYSN